MQKTNTKQHHSNKSIKYMAHHRCYILGIAATEARSHDSKVQRQVQNPNIDLLVLKSLPQAMLLPLSCSAF